MLMQEEGVLDNKRREAGDDDARKRGTRRDEDGEEMFFQFSFPMKTKLYLERR